MTLPAGWRAVPVDLIHKIAQEADTMGRLYETGDGKHLPVGHFIDVGQMVDRMLAVAPSPSSAEPLQGEQVTWTNGKDTFTSTLQSAPSEFGYWRIPTPAQQPPPTPSDPMTDAQMRHAAKHDNSCVGAFARARPRKPTK